MEIVPQSSLGMAEGEEPHGSFVENALAKARHASRRSRLPALADDSGICVGALGGEPGVHSARFAGEPPPGSTPVREVQDARNNEKLVQLLAGKDDRRAHYYCVIVLLRHAEDPEPVIAEGSWAGRSSPSPAGRTDSATTRIFSCGISARPPPSSILSRRISSATAARRCGGCSRSCREVSDRERCRRTGSVPSPPRAASAPGARPAQSPVPE